MIHKRYVNNTIRLKILNRHYKIIIYDMYMNVNLLMC